MKLPRNPETAPTQETLPIVANRVARIFGYGGLHIEMNEGGGWATRRDPGGITLLADPSMLRPSEMADIEGVPVQTEEIPDQYPMYGICHELGHVEDYLDPISDFESLKKMSSSERFFWNVLDDGVINKRLRRIPMLDSLTDEIYEKNLFRTTDFSKMPKHVQLMYGYLFKQVTPHREFTVSDDVREKIDEFEHHVLTSGEVCDIYETLAGSDTSLASRRELASETLLITYKNLLEKDKQDRQNKQKGQGDGSPSSGQPENDNGDGGSNGDQSNQTETEDWDDTYNKYNEATGCSHGEHEADKNDATSTSSQDAKKATEEMRDAIRKAAQEASSDAKAAKEAPKKSAGDQDGDSVAIAAGNIQKELEITHKKAYMYAESIVRLRSSIQEVAEAFQALTVPTVEYTSPRYRQNPSIRGSKLSARDLFRVVIAQNSQGVEPVVWRPTEVHAHREGYSFSGLDIHLLVDVSQSMEGAKAIAAADCFVLLSEGIELARKIASQRNPMAPKPDVREQTIVFGSDSKVVSRIGHGSRPVDKGNAFSTIIDAPSPSTYVAKSIAKASETGRQFPERTQLLYIITDGSFSDTAPASAEIAKLAPNVFVAQFIIQSQGTTPIAKQFAHLSDPATLPAMLKAHLTEVANSLQ